MIAASCEETARPMSDGLEFDVKLAQHTAVDVLPSGDAETEPGRDSMSQVRKTRKGGNGELGEREPRQETNNHRT